MALRLDDGDGEVIEIDGGAGVGNSPDTGPAFGGFSCVRVFEGDGPVFGFGGAAGPDFALNSGLFVLFGELEAESEPGGGFPVVGFGGFDVVAFEDLQFADGGLEPEAVAGGAAEAEAEFGEAFAGARGSPGSSKNFSSPSLRTANVPLMTRSSSGREPSLEFWKSW